MQFISTRSTQRYNTSSIFDNLSFSHTSLITEDYTPSCHFYLSYFEHMYVCRYTCRSGILEMLATLHSGVSTFSIKESHQIYMYKKIGMCAPVPFSYHWRHFCWPLPSKGHSVTDFQDLGPQNHIQQAGLNYPQNFIPYHFLFLL